MTWSNEAVEKIYSKVKAKALVNKDFRKKLLDDPKKAISEISGESIPNDFKIQIVESDPKANMAFMLPPMVDESLSESDLENVSGGACIGEFAPCVGNVCGAAK